MPSLRFLLAVAALFTVCSQVSAQQFMDGYLTTEDYRSFDLPTRRAYAVGFANALLVTPMVTREDKSTQWLNTCLRRMKAFTLATILDKFLEDRPELWSEPFNKLSFLAIQRACQRLDQN